MTGHSVEIEKRITAVDILPTDFEIRKVSPGDIKIAGGGRSQKRAYVDDERSLSRVKDFEAAYTANGEVPPLILEELVAHDGTKTLFLVDGNHRLRAIHNLNGTGPAQVSAYVITRALSEHDRAALTCQANSGGPLPMLEAEMNGHIADSLSEGVTVDNIVKHYPNVTKQRVDKIKRGMKSKTMLEALGVSTRLKSDLAGTNIVGVLKKIHDSRDQETARRLDKGIKLLNSNKLSGNEFQRVFSRCVTHDPAERVQAHAELDDVLRSAERGRNSGVRAKHVSISTLKSDLKRLNSRDDDELARLARDVNARDEIEIAITKLNRALKATDA